MIARARRLLLIPAAGLVLLGTPVLALDGRPVPQPATTRVPIITPFGPAGPGFSGEAATPADVVGVVWSGDPATQFRVDVRRAGGGWATAGTLATDDLGPDAGTPDAAAHLRTTGGRNVTEPLWVDDAEAVRVTVVAGSVNDLSVEAVVADDATAPSGSVGALGAMLPTGDDRFGFAVALVLGGGVLAALAVGWSPWRSRRQAALLAAVGVLVLAACAPPPSPNALQAGQPPITMRSQWGPDLAWNPSEDCKPGPELAGFMSGVVVHHTVNSNTYGPNDSRAMVRAMWQYHVGTLGYCDIAYNFVVDKYGQIFEGRMGGIDKPVIAAHSGGFNTGTSGMAFLGTYMTEQPPQAAWDAMVNLIAWKLSVHYLDPATGMILTSRSSASKFPEGTSVSFPNKILGHRDLWATACPGNALYPRMAELRTAVQAKVGWDPNAPTTTTTTGPVTTTTT